MTPQGPPDAHRAEPVRAGEDGPVEVCSDRWYRFAATRPHVWDTICSIDSFQAWWPWLKEFRGETLREGARWHCAVSPPLPYVVRFTLTLVEVEEGHSIRAVVDGDIGGSAELQLLDDGASSCLLHLTSDLAPTQPALRIVASAARPVVRRGHDWVLDTGARQFRDRAL